MVITIKKNEIVYNYETKEDLKRKKDGEYVLKKYVRIRTTQQNKYLHGYIYKTIEDDTGTESDIIHEEMKFMFLKDNTGRFPRIKSTTELTTVEFNKFIEQVKLFWLEFQGVVFLSKDEYENF